MSDPIRERLDAFLPPRGLSHIEQGTLVVTIAAVLDIHRPWKIYDDCGHRHQDPDEPGVIDVEDVGYTCAAGLMYSICRSCCTSGEYQTEDCATYHAHGEDQSICETVAALAEKLGANVE